MEEQAIQEVSESTKSLRNAIEDTDVETPPLMSFNRWQTWRSTIGKRPTMLLDGAITSNRFEADLWRSTMSHVHGETWHTELTLRQVDEEEAERAAAQPSSLPGVPQAPGPRSGTLPDLAAAQLASPRATGHNSPGSGQAADRAGSGPGSGGRAEAYDLS
jgi:hypothetical protein